jgi:hypothetical protein
VAVQQEAGPGRIAIVQKPSRTLWIAAILVAVLCVGGLAYGLITDWNAEPDQTVLPAAQSSRHGGFAFGLLVGIGAGIVIGSLIAVRKKRD